METRRATGRSRIRAMRAPDLETIITSGEAAYGRARILPRLIPVSVDTAALDDLATAERIVGLLQRAVRSERTKGRAGHWTYDLNRHLGLIQALRAETATLRLLRKRRARASVRPPAPAESPGPETCKDSPQSREAKLAKP